MARNLSSDMDSDFLNVCLNTNEFADTVIYTAIGTSPRPIPAIVTTTPANLADHAAHQTDESGIEVLCSTDPFTGIPNQQMGDSLIYNGNGYDYWATVGGSRNQLVTRWQQTKITHFGHSKPPSL